MLVPGRRGRHAPVGSWPHVGLRQVLPAGLLAVGYALSVVIGLQIHFEDISGGVDSTYFDWWPLPRAVLAAALVAACVFGLTLLVWAAARRWRHVGPSATRAGFPWRRFALVMLALLVCWVPYYLGLYPGVVVPDTIASITQIQGDAPLSNHHPVAFTLLLGAFVRAFPGDINHGVFAFAVMQGCVMAAVLSYLTCRVAQGRLGRWWVVLMALLFGLSPVFPIYALNVQKDTLFSCLLVLFGMELWRELEAPGRLGHALVVAALGVGVAVFRGNGVYVATASIVVALLVRLRHGLRPKELVGPLAFALAVFVALPLAMAGRVEPTQSAESLGIPLQQVARTIVTGGEIDEADRAFLYRLLPEDGWEEYAPTLADNIKWDARFDDEFLAQHEREFLEVWARGLVRNPGTYAEAYALETFGFWVPGAKDAYGFMDAYVTDNAYGIERTNFLDQWLGVPLMRTVVNSATFLGSGTLLWLALAAVALMAMDGRGRSAVLVMPALICVGTILIATPVAFSLRYVFVLALGVPFYLAVGLCRHAPQLP